MFGPDLEVIKFLLFQKNGNGITPREYIFPGKHRRTLYEDGCPKVVNYLLPCCLSSSVITFCDVCLVLALFLRFS